MTQVTKACGILSCLSYRTIVSALFASFAFVGCDNESTMLREALVETRDSLTSVVASGYSDLAIDSSQPGITAVWQIMNGPSEWSDSARYVLWCNFKPVGVIKKGAKYGKARIPFGEKEISGEASRPTLTHNQIEFGLSVVNESKVYYFSSKWAFYLKDTIGIVFVYFTPNDEEKIRFEVRPKSVVVH